MLLRSFLRLPLFLLPFNLALEVKNLANETFVSCGNENIYNDLDINQMYGKWKVVEEYMHLNNEGVILLYNCPVVTIRPVNENQLYHVQSLSAQFRQKYRYLRLLWDEAGQTIEYALYFSNDSTGYWQAFDNQTGSLTLQPAYQSFGGTVQVLKAVNDHMVLNFCQEADRSTGRPAQLYSVLFSRDPGRMTRWEVDSVHTLLQNKNLSVASRRMVCGNGAERPLYSIFVSLLSCIFAYAIGSS